MTTMTRPPSVWRPWQGRLRLWDPALGRRAAPREDLRPFARAALAEWGAVVVLLDVNTKRPTRVSEAMIKEWERIGAAVTVTQAPGRVRLDVHLPGHPRTC